ncbi:MAG TPA: tetratricopeptide repeat protein [Candidatus Methylomirabilis sp.]|nr:tetratricopeptide repeat protein [Candidatus Methylomirabilis sp.]
MNAQTPERIFTLRELTRFLRLTPKRLAQLRRLGVLRDEPSGYRFRELVAARTAAALLEAGATVRQVRDALQGARRLAPDAAEPLSEVRLALDQNRVVVEHDRLRFDPRTGQALLDFEMGDLEQETRESLQTGMVRPLAAPADAAETWFARASARDADPAHWEEAIEAYERVVAIDPGYAAAWNNLGLLEHRMGHYAPAGQCYRKALEADETCCQAAFNLGSLHEDLGDLASAIGWYRRALELEPDYADAHFNLAGVLAKSGRSDAAALHWRRYLALDTGSPWAEIARSHLEGHPSPEPDE